MTLAATLGTTAPVATAAGPVPGARYTGVTRDGGAWAELDVSRSGRSFRARGSSIELVDARCGRPALRRVFRRRSLGSELRIRRTGTFTLARRAGRFALLATGRFVSRNAVALRVLYRRTPTRRSQPCDDSGIRRLTLRRVRPGRPAGCGQRGRTLAWSPQGRIFGRALATGDRYVPYVNHAFGCLFARDRAFELDEDQRPDSNLRLFRLAGPFAGYAQDACPMGCGFNVFVVDLRTGAKVRRVGIGTSGGRGGPATDFELSSGGSIGWIVHGSRDEVRAHDIAGERLLDSGPGIALTSLALSGDTLTWTRNGIRRSAPLR